MNELLSAAFHVMRVAWRTGPRAVVVVFGEMVSTILRVVQPLTVGLLVGGLASGNLAPVYGGTGLLVASLGLGGALEAMAVGYRVRLIEDIGAAFDRDLMTSLAQIPSLDRLEEPKLARAIAVARDRADMMGYCFNSLMSVILQATAPLTSIIVAVVIDPRLLILTLAGLPTIVVARRVAGIHDRADEVAQGHGSRATAWADLLVDPNARAERRVFGLWEWYRKSVANALGAREDAYFHAARRDSAASTLAEIFYLCCAGAILLWIFGPSASQPSPGKLVAALLVSLDLKGTFDALRFALSGLGPALRTAVAIRSVGAAAVEAAAAEAEAHTTLAGDKALHMVNASYTYAGAEVPALCEVDLVIEPGEVVAVVGVNGAGKTTLVELLLGLRSPTAGDAVVPLGRRSIVAQNFGRFEVALAEAVALDDLSALDETQIERVRQSLDMAAPRAFWEEQGEGIRVQLGPSWPGGTDLSVGQWQSVAAARCFFADGTELLVLDEPTAALDPEAQQEMTTRYASRARQAADDGGAAILITHRMSMPRLADRIIVLDGGRIVETGAHEELLGLGGLYAAAYGAQVSGFLSMGDGVAAGAE